MIQSFLALQYLMQSRDVLLHFFFVFTAVFQVDSSVTHGFKALLFFSCTKKLIFSVTKQAVLAAKCLQNCQYSHRVLWSPAPWIEPSVHLSVCGWFLFLTQRWDLASLEWRWGLCRWLPALDTARDKHILGAYSKQLEGTEVCIQVACIESNTGSLQILLTVPSLLVYPPVGGGCPSYGETLRVCPNENETDSWQLSLWLSLQQQSVWTVLTHTDPASLVREPWRHMSSDRCCTGVCSLSGRLTLR